MQIIDTKSLTKDLGKLKTAFSVIGANAFPATRLAAGKASAYIQQTWISFASGNPIPGLAGKTVNNKEYRDNIQRVKIGDYDYLIFVANEKIGDKVEEDQPRVDLKEHLPFPKSRFTKDGKPYSRIPFKQKVKSLGKEAPEGTADKIKKMPKSFVAGSYIDENGIKRFSYSWARRSKKLDQALKGSKQAGIIRFDTSAGKKKSSAYMTFRTISANSPADSWIIKARPGVPLSKIVADETRPEVIKMIQEGINQDLKIL